MRAFSAQSSLTRLFIFSVICISFVPVSQGQTVRDWDNTTGIDPWYHLGSNWSAGSAPTSTEKARFNQASTYEVWWDADTASTTPEVGYFEVLQGDVTFLNKDTDTQYLYTINGSGGDGAFSDFSISGASTSSTISGLHFKSLGGGQIVNGGTLTLDGSHAMGSQLTVAGSTGFDVSGTLNVNAGAIFDNTTGYIGYDSGSTGVATVSGSGSQWNNSGFAYVGSLGNGTLNVEAGGVVSNSRGYIGSLYGSTGVATVTGSGSQWNNSADLYVGSFGNGTLNVLDGGVVSNTTGVIGTWSGSTGVATVSGSGSQWNNSDDLFVGYYYGSGTLNVEAGGVVSNSDGVIAYVSGSTGVATVTGSGSQWNNSGSLYIGGSDSDDGGDGTLNVEAGGVVNNTAGYIGSQEGSTGVATVTGSGSQWNNSTKLYVGDEGNGTLNVENGGLVSNTNDGFIGYNSGSTGTATVTGSGSHLNNSSFFSVGWNGNGTLNVLDGGLVSSTWGGYVGYGSGSTGTVTVSGSGSHWNNSGDLSVGETGNGTLNVENGGLVSNAIGLIGYASATTGSVTVSGSGSQWNNSGHLLMGYSGSGTLNVEDGGVVSNDAGYIGYNSGSTGTATVTGSGSQWNNSGFAYVGNFGNGTLNVEAGGVVSNSRGYIGSGLGSTGVATVTGSGSQWNNSNRFYVGNKGNGTLNVEAGGVVSNTKCYIGSGLGSTGVATVTGSGSQWNNSDYLYVGWDGNGTLNVLDGGLVSNTRGYIGHESGSTGVVTVSGSGSQWNNSSFFYVGNSGNGTLNVENGGVVSNTGAIIGFRAGSTGTATVSGSGSQLNNSGGLSLGGTSTFGSGTGSLSIQDSAQVNAGNDLNTSSGTSLTVSDTGTNGNLWVGNGSTISNGGHGYIGLSSGSTGVATVSGSGSQWNNSDYLYVGWDGNGTLNVLDGGLVSNTRGYIGHKPGSTGVATVSGSGSQWNNSGILLLGWDGSGTLNVEAGGVVSNTTGAIGSWPGSTGVATVSGSGSQWNNSGNLSVGEAGNGTLNVLDGGVVSNTTGVICTWAGSTGAATGAATVSGSGSRWANSGDLLVGGYGTASLNISDGGVVENAYGFIGFDNGSSGTVTVAGSGSQWNSADNLFVGRAGAGVLQVQSSGVVNSVAGIIGEFGGSAGTATVSGSGSQWNASSDFYIGGSNVAAGGSGTLTVSEGGLVDVTGTTKLWSTGTLTLDGGSLTTGNFDNSEVGTFNFNTGTLQITDSSQALTIGASHFSLTNGTTFNTDAGTTTLGTDQHLNIAGAATIASDGVLTMAGGSLTSGSFTNNGTIHTTGGTSTLAGDMQNNGGFQVDTGSGLLFLDDLSGTGPFTGGGEVTFQGGLNPGNSPGTIEFGGDVTLGATSLTTIEIAGLDTADFDRLLLNNVDALLTIENGAGLDVQLINGFSLGFNQEFIFADVAGSNAVAGTFSGLGEGDLVGNFGGFDLFISYGAGTGNDISFFTSVPEPGALVMFGLVVGLGGMGRRRRRRTA